MSKEAYITFQRTVVLTEEDIEGLSDDQIRSEAVDIWNNDMELEDILMDEDDIVKTEIVELNSKREEI